MKILRAIIASTAFAAIASNAMADNIRGFYVGVQGGGNHLYGRTGSNSENSKSGGVHLGLIEIGPKGGWFGFGLLFALEGYYDFMQATLSKTANENRVQQRNLYGLNLKLGQALDSKVWHVYGILGIAFADTQLKTADATGERTFIGFQWGLGVGREVGPFVLGVEGTQTLFGRKTITAQGSERHTATIRPRALSLKGRVSYLF